MNQSAHCCDTLQHAIDNDIFPLIYDDHVEEVQLLLLGEGGVAMVWHCPFCGQKLESGRSKLFTQPTDADCEDVHQQLKSLASLNDVITKLGEPDERGTGCGPQTNPWKQWVRYMNVWDSLCLTIGEHENGKLSWGITGKPLSNKSD